MVLAALLGMALVGWYAWITRPVGQPSTPSRQVSQAPAAVVKPASTSNAPSAPGTSPAPRVVAPMPAPLPAPPPDASSAIAATSTPSPAPAAAPSIAPITPRTPVASPAVSAEASITNPPKPDPVVAATIATFDAKPDAKSDTAAGVASVAPAQMQNASPVEAAPVARGETAEPSSQSAPASVVRSSPTVAARRESREAREQKESASVKDARRTRDSARDSARASTTETRQPRAEESAQQNAEPARAFDPEQEPSLIIGPRRGSASQDPARAATDAEPLARSAESLALGPPLPANAAIVSSGTVRPEAPLGPIAAIPLTPTPPIRAVEPRARSAESLAIGPPVPTGNATTSTSGPAATGTLDPAFDPGRVCASANPAATASCVSEMCYRAGYDRHPRCVALRQRQRREAAADRTR